MPMCFSVFLRNPFRSKNVGNNLTGKTKCLQKIVVIYLTHTLINVKRRFHTRISHRLYFRKVGTSAYTSERQANKIWSCKWPPVVPILIASQLHRCYGSDHKCSTYPSIQRRLRNNQDCIDKSVGLLRLKHIGRWLRNVGYRMEREQGWGALLSINQIGLLLASFVTI